MPFQSSLNLLKQIAALVKLQIDKDSRIYKADIKTETLTFINKMQELHIEINFIYNKLKAYQLLEPTNEEANLLNEKINNLFSHIKKLNKNLIDIQITYNEIVIIRQNYKQKWYRCFLCFCNCKCIYSKKQFIIDIQIINDQIQTNIDIIKKNYNELEILILNVFNMTKTF